MVYFHTKRSKSHNVQPTFLKLIRTYWIGMCSSSIKFQENILSFNKVIQFWNFVNFGIPEITPKSLVTLRFLKFFLQELIGSFKMFQMRYWPNFYVDLNYSNAYFFKLDKWRVYLQATVLIMRSKIWYTNHSSVSIQIPSHLDLRFLHGTFYFCGS